MAVTVYKSTDTGAPTLTNAAGSLVNLLDAVLVNGYGSKSSQGWSIEYTDTNKRVYRQPTGTNRFYLRVDDTGLNTARVRGWEVKSDINDNQDANNTGPFPTIGQSSGGLYWGKSNSATARPWWVYGNEKMFYFVTRFTGGECIVYVFGDFDTYRPGDAYGTVIVGGTSNEATYFGLKITAGGQPGIVLARPYTQGGSATYGGWATSGIANTGYLGISGLTFPNPTDSRLYLSPLHVMESSISVLRGKLPGAWEPQHAPASFTTGDTFTGVGALAGRTFELLRIVYLYNSGVVAMETSNTW